MEQFKVWSGGASCFALVLAVLLLIAGVLLLKRRPSADRLCVIWSLLKVVSVVVSVWVGYLIQQAQFEAMAEGPNTSMPPMAGAMLHVISGVGLGLGLLWGLALPVFMLIWFSRGKIKSQIAAWS